jgi:hypothetical protein
MLIFGHPIGRQSSGGRRFVLVALGALLAGFGVPVHPQSAGGVAGTKHNLSASGPGELRALNETQICKFCHVPHSSVQPEALWGQKLSTEEYQVPDVRSRSGTRMRAPQPDGSSRLCLSCHDGTVALGDLAGRRRVPMVGAAMISPGRSGYLGTDLTGSHPISFVVPDGDYGSDSAERDMGLRPLSSITGSRDVNLDAEGKMQCTTCHDPHKDEYHVEGQVPHFWVRPTVLEVCLTCHEVR